MEIVQVATGLISIPPNGWGAVERIIWEYHNNLLELEVNSKIQNWNEVEKKENQLVHCHMANTAIDMKNKGIPYIYSLHDHHAEWYGKNSGVYNYNLEAIKGSVFSICHSKHILEQFNGTDKLVFLEHGVNTNFFEYRKHKGEHSLLMIANNGIAGDSGIDRKGFRYAIEAAYELNLNITIAGPENNLEFFKSHPDLIKPNVKLVCNNPTDNEILELYQNHSIFLAPSFLEYGHPNLSLLEATSCGLPIVGTCNNPPQGMIVCELSTESVVNSLKMLMTKEFDYFREKQLITRNNHDWSKVVYKLNKMYNVFRIVNDKWDSEKTKTSYVNAYV